MSLLTKLSLWLWDLDPTSESSGVTRRNILGPVHPKDLICFWYPGWKLAAIRAWWRMRPWHSPFWTRFLDWSGGDMVLRPYNDIEEAQQIQDKKFWFWWECRPWRLHD